MAVLMAGLAGGLAGCGGGTAAQPDRQAGRIGQGNASSEPPLALAMNDFQAMARAASCAESRNRLFIIDGKQVLWDHAGNCADASYEQVLFGARPDAVLCSHGDTIAGARTTCADAASRAMFETIIQNLDKADLGLGSAHKVESIGFLPTAGVQLPFQTLSQTSVSGVHQARNVVVKDAETWRSLWQEHAPDTPAPVADFNSRMAVAVFMGYTNPCYSASIGGVSRETGRIVVHRIDRHPPMGVMCAMLVTTPAHLVAIERSDLPVEFSTEIVVLN